MNEPVLDSWTGVRACVIGGTGFLGYQIVDRLLARKAIVRVLAPDAPPDHPIRSRSGVEWIVGDVRDSAVVAAAVDRCRVVFQASGPVFVGTAERTAQLDPHTIAVLEQSVAVIDSAIAQSRAALAKDPASGLLATQLNYSLEKKVELLRTAALLPART